MKVTLSLDDDLADFYTREAASRRMAIGTVINERLTRALPLDPRKRSVVIGDADVIHRLEQALGGGHLLGERDLLGKVERLARIEFGPHTFQITPGQFEELKFRAGKTGRSVEQLVMDMYTKMSEDFFRAVP
jgi:hypothetical protein